MLHEYLKWCVKQSPTNQDEIRASKPKALIKKLYSLWVHPKANYRLAASLAFNNIYTVFREEQESLVDVFTMEIFVHVMQSLAISDQQNNSSNNNIVITEANDAIGHLLRILKQKRALFEKPSKNLRRRRPREFPEDCKVTLQDLNVWLLKWLSRPETSARHKALEVLHELGGQDVRSIFQQFLKAKHKGNMAAFLENIVVVQEQCKTKRLESLIMSVECLNWMLDKQLIQDSEVKEVAVVAKDIPRFFEDVLARKDQVQGQIDLRTTRALNSLLCTAIVRIMELTTQLKLDKNKFWSTKLSRVIFLTAVDPTSIGFDTREIEVQKGLVPMMRAVLLHVKEFFAKDVNELCREFILDEIERIFKKEFARKQMDIVRGLKLMASTIKAFDSSKLIESEEIVNLCKDGSNSSPLGKEVASELLDLVLQTEATSNMILDLLQQGGDDFSDYLPVIFQHCLAPSVLPTVIKSNKVNVEILVKFVRHVSKTETDAKLKKTLVKELCENWNRFKDFAMEDDKNLVFSIYLIKYMSTIDKAELSRGGRDAMLPWLLSLLGNKGHKLKLKNHILQILPVFDNNEDGEKLANALKDLSNQNFPLTSDELTPGTSAHSDYAVTFERLCQWIEATASATVFDFVLGVVCREENHLALDRIATALNQVGKTGNNSRTKIRSLIQIGFVNVFDRDDHPVEVKLRALENFLLPILSGTSKGPLISFYTDTIATLLEAIMAGSVTGSEAARKKALAKRLAAYKLIAFLYSRSSKDVVHTVGSRVVQAAFDFLKSRGEVAANAKQAGNEMSKFLVSKLKKVRAEVIDGSAELRDMFRRCQCEAYNTMMAVISCIQTQEKIFNQFLFKEEPDKSEFIWSRIIDCEAKLSFDLELDDVPEKKKQLVSIRQTTASEAAESRGRHALHFLSDSSLTQDLSTFDFHDSLVDFNRTEEESNGVEEAEEKKPYQDMSDMNTIEVECEDFGRHECMAQLMGLVDFMTKEKVYDTDNTDVLPVWMKFMKDKLESPASEANVKMFILRLILNCRETFKPYARFFVKTIMSVITSEELWSEGTDVVNYFSLDLIIMLLSWSDVYSPDKDSIMEKNLASRILDSLANAAKHPKREVFRHILNVIQWMLSAWKPALTIIYASVHKLFSNHNRDENIVGIQLLGHLLENGHPPFAKTTVDDKIYFGDLMRNLDSTKKEINQATAEVLGFALQYYKDNKIESDLHSQVKKCLQNILRNDAKSKEKFVNCLYKCSTHYNDMAVDFAPTFVYSLSQYSKTPLTQCLKMLAMSVGYFEDRVQEGSEWKKELEIVDIKKYLVGQNNEVNQLAALTFFEAVTRKICDLKPLVISSYMDILSSTFTTHHSVECRTKLFDIMKFIYLKSSNNAMLKSKAKAILLRGLSDQNPEIVGSLTEFFRSDDLDGLGVATMPRLAALFGSLLTDESEDAFLNVCPDLMLSLAETTPDYKREVYGEPLDQCVFSEMNIDTSWRSQFETSSIAPMFAETMAMTQMSQTMSSQGQPHIIRATQQSLAFTPTQQQNSGGSTISTQFESSINSTLSTSDSLGFEAGQFRVGPGDFTFGTMSTSLTNGGPMTASNMPKSIRFGRRFSKKDKEAPDYHEKSKAQFAKMHQKKVVFAS